MLVFIWLKGFDVAFADQLSNWTRENLCSNNVRCLILPSRLESSQILLTSLAGAKASVVVLSEK